VRKLSVAVTITTRIITVLIFPTTSHSQLSRLNCNLQVTQCNTW